MPRSRQQPRRMRGGWRARASLAAVIALCALLLRQADAQALRGQPSAGAGSGAAPASIDASVQQAQPEQQAEAPEQDAYGKAMDLEGSASDEGSEVAAVFGAEIALSFLDDYAAAAAAGGGPEEGAKQQEQEVDADGTLLVGGGQLADLMTSESAWPFCAWDATADKSIYTPLLLDVNAVYQPQLLSFASHANRVYRIKARYSKGVYFSYQSYTLDGQPLTSITDLRIKPAWGLNPFRDINATCDTAGGYEIYVTKEGNRGWPNELKGMSTEQLRNNRGFPRLRQGGFLSNLAVVMLRFYSVRPPQLIWGGAEPPEIAYSDDDGKSWRIIEGCRDNERQRFNNLMAGIGRTTHVLQNVIRNNARLRWETCNLMARPEADVPNFFPSHGTKTSGSENYVPFANYDSEYIFWCTDGAQLGPDFVMIVTGTAPTTASGLYDPPLRVADTAAYDVRYWGLQASDLNGVRPTYSSISAVMMEDYYGPGWDRKYKVVAARNRDIAKACGLDDPGAMFLPFSNPAANVTEPPAFPVILAREQLARATALRWEKGERESIRGVVEGCRATKRCHDPNFLKELMGLKAPALQVFKCDVATGKATPFVYQPIAQDELPQANGRRYGGVGGEAG